MANISKFIQTSETPSLRLWKTVQGEITLKAGTDKATVDIPIENRHFIVNSMVRLKGSEWWAVGQFWAENAADKITYNGGMPVHSDWAYIILMHYQISKQVYRVSLENDIVIGYHKPNRDVTCEYRLDFFLSPFDTET